MCNYLFLPLQEIACIDSLQFNFKILKQFRYLFVAAILSVSIFSMVLYTSCKKNNCGSLNCQNGGACTDSKCVCPTGYSGNSCQAGWSDLSIGTYNCVKSNCTPAVSGASTWQSSITKDATSGGYKIHISNFDASNITVTASIDSAINGRNNIIVSTATGTAGIQASGYYSNNVINLHFTTSSVGGVGGYQCDMAMTKR
jgi:hypothetical protein